MKKFNEFNKLNEEITYEQLGLKSPTYEDNVRNKIVSIIMDENSISEKSFEQIDKIILHVKLVFNKNLEIKDVIKEFENKKERVSYCSEYVYSKYKK